jgi:hypothetical protein
MNTQRGRLRPSAELKLDVLTFDRPQSYKTRTLVPKNRFHAEAGQVGYIYEPCIHDAKNISQDWSLSLHVISPWDGRHAGDFEDCLPLSQPPLATSTRAILTPQ